MKKVVVLAATFFAALGVMATSATSRSNETGVTAKTVVIGGTFPLTGPAAAYAPIPLGMKAYFAYVNKRRGPDGKRGVMGRQIVWKYYDHGYNTATSLQLARKLVQEDKVFATVGDLAERLLPVQVLAARDEPGRGLRVRLGHDRPPTSARVRAWSARRRRITESSRAMVSCSSRYSA